MADACLPFRVRLRRRGEPIRWNLFLQDHHIRDHIVDLLLSAVIVFLARHQMPLVVRDDIVDTFEGLALSSATPARSTALIPQDARIHVEPCARTHLVQEVQQMHEG